jgi:glycosyltransferase involved in cell wall biosynthesis
MKQITTNLQGASLWIANDWWMLPIAAAGQQASGGAIAYDSHELAIEEFSENRLWRKFQRPIVAAIESEFIGRAEVVTSVSPGITEFLRTSYKLTAPTFTLRNSPRYRELAFRPTPSKIEILYQGLVRPGRGLEAAIRSVPLWRPEFELTIRGPAETRYLAELKKLASAGGASARIKFEPAVPMTELVAYAAASDVGLMALPDMSLHTRSALPNKLFEYMMAGLALIVTDLPEMATLVRTTGSGRTISDLSPASIAATINGLDRDRIDTMKRASLRAAKQYNWETESAPVLEAYAALARAGGA